MLQSHIELSLSGLLIRGFIQREFAGQIGAFQREMAQWISSGDIQYKEDIVAGLENAPRAFMGLLEGKNFGKLLVKVSDA